MSVTRREFATVAGWALGSLAFSTACHAVAPLPQDGKLRSRARRTVQTTASGSSRLGLANGRDATLQLPAKAAADAVPLMVLLHGAGGSGDGILRRLGQHASDAGVAVLSPDSRDGTWDAIRGSFGPDVEFINRCLDRVFERVNVDANRISVGGFSDGATYALSLGLINGDLFRRIVAYSPGFVVGGEVAGKPQIYVSHGNEDEILPVDRCSRRIVPVLKRNGYTVTYKEFIGGHTVPADIAAAGMTFAASA